VNRDTVARLLLEHPTVGALCISQPALRVQCHPLIQVGIAPR